MRKLKLLLFLICIGLSVHFFAFSTSADEDAKILQAYFTGDTLNVFVTEISAGSEITAKIGNEDAIISNDASYKYGEMDIYTTIIVDNSRSMPISMRGSVYTLLENIIDRAGDNDYYRIISFDTDYRIICGFTNDRYDLSKHSRSFDFDGDSSMVYNTIFETIPEMKAGQLPRYYRTIVITDGSDKSKSGVTYEELYNKLNNTYYTVDVISVTKEQEANQNKNLASITRISGGTYMNFHPGVSVTEILNNINADQTLRWIEIGGNENDYDGAIRQVTLKLGGQDVYIDIKFPLLDKSVSESLLSEEENDNLTPEAQSKDNLTLYIIIVIACIFFVSALCVALIILLQKNKKIKKNNDENKSQPAGMPEELHEKSACFDTISFYMGSDMMIIGSESVYEGCEIVFGRSKECNIVLEKSTVSRKQFSVYMKNAELYIKNISSSNITLLNGKTLSHESVIKDGDKLKCGRETIIVKTSLSNTIFVNV